MPALILEFLKAHWFGALMGALAVAGVAIIGIEHLEISHLDSKIVTLQMDNTTLTNNNKALSTSLDTQNAAISSLKAQSDAKQQAAATALAKAVKTAQKYQSRYNAIHAQKLTADDCQNMKNTVDLYFTKVKP